MPASLLRSRPDGATLFTWVRSRLPETVQTELVGETRRGMEGDAQQAADPSEKTPLKDFRPHARHLLFPSCAGLRILIAEATHARDLAPSRLLEYNGT